MILDNAAADWKAKIEAHEAEFDEALDAKIADLKSQVDARAEAAIATMEAWLAEM